MKKISLCFYSSDLENTYAKYNMKSNMGVFKKNLVFYACVALSVSIYSFIAKSWILGCLSISYALQLPMMFLIVQKGPKYFDYFCFAISTTINLSVPIASLLDVVSGPISDANSYLVGQAITQVVMSFNLGSRCDLKMITIFLNIFPQLLIKIFIYKEMTGLLILWLGSNFMIMYYIWQQERLLREAFLAKYNENLWQQEIGNCAQISIMTAVSDHGKLILNLDKCNKIAQSQFSITDLDSYKDFLNNVKVIQKRYFSTSKVFNNIQSSSRYSKFASLHTQIDKYSHQIQCNNEMFMGYYDQRLYEIQIFTTWKQQQLFIHSLIKQSTAQTQIENLQKIQQEVNLLKNFRQNIGIQLKTIIAHLKFTGQNIEGRQQLKCKLVSIVYNALRLNYNLQLYLSPCYELKQAQLLLLPLILKVNQVIQNNMPYPHQLKIVCLVDPNLQLYSCQKTIFHILFNIYSAIIGKVLQSGKIILKVHQKYTPVGQVIDFCIETNIRSNHLMSNQNYHKNIYQRNQDILAQEEKFGLEMVVSEYLISKIGPFRRIKLNEISITKLSVSFSVFQDLQVINQ